jgi:hypothetical protein
MVIWLHQQEIISKIAHIYLLISFFLSQIICILLKYFDMDKIYVNVLILCL